MCVIYAYFSQQSFYHLHNWQNIETRQYLVNMNAIGGVVKTESTIYYFYLYVGPRKSYSVVLYRKRCIQKCISILCNATNMNTFRTYNKNWNVKLSSPVKYHSISVFLRLLLSIGFEIERQWAWDECKTIVRVPLD